MNPSQRPMLQWLEMLVAGTPFTRCVEAEGMDSEATAPRAKGVALPTEPLGNVPNDGHWREPGSRAEEGQGAAGVAAFARCGSVASA